MESDPFLTDQPRQQHHLPSGDHQAPQMADDSNTVRKRSSLIPNRFRNSSNNNNSKVKNYSLKNQSVGVPINTTTTVGASVLIFFPFLYFLIISLLYAFVYHHSTLGTFVPIGVLFVIAISLGMLHLVERVKRLSGPWYLFMGILLTVSIVFAIICGSYNYNHYFARYWTYNEYETYTQVYASEPAASKADAGKITFAPGVTLNKLSAVGFKSGTRYCAAPIVDSADSTVNYFAVGKNCCNSRATFNCDDSDMASARSGVVVLPSDIDYDAYLRAVRLCQAVNNFDSPKAAGTGDTPAANGGGGESNGATTDAVSNNDTINPIILRWVEDTGSLQGDYYSKGVGFLVASVFIYLFISVLLGAILAYTGRKYQRFSVGNESTVAITGGGGDAAFSSGTRFPPRRTDSFMLSSEGNSEQNGASEMQHAENI